MTFLIIATLIISVVYFLTAFIATMRDRLMSRFDNNCFQSLPDVVVTDCEDIPQVLAEPKIQDATVTDYVAKNIRELRGYIRENGLQDVVRAKVGKNVSKCSKGELLMAIA